MILGSDNTKDLDDHTGKIRGETYNLYHMVELGEHGGNNVSCSATAAGLLYHLVSDLSNAGGIAPITASAIPKFRSYSS